MSGSADTADRRFRVFCDECDWQERQTYPNALVARAEAERHDERQHDGQECADVEAVNVATDGGLSDQARTAMDLLDAHEEDEGAPLGTVVERLAAECGTHTALRILAAMLDDGVAYVPQDTRLRLVYDVDDLTDVDRGEGILTDGGQVKQAIDPESDRVDPENLPRDYTPAYVDVREQGPVYVANYIVLDSGWIAVREWSGDRAKLPPHRVRALRDVRTERYGEPDHKGRQSRRVADEDQREQAHAGYPDQVDGLPMREDEVDHGRGIETDGGEA